MVRNGNFYSWPVLDDLLWQDINNIVCLIPEALMDNRDYFQFPETSMTEAESEVMKQPHVACICFK